ncbi:hypothetical protein, partial [Bacillus toyonensis]|uniref:hypothetical protein n=1 Tax=Bacillus toyonensis TaxID=155322 RepID=UPI000BED5EDE
SENDKKATRIGVRVAFLNNAYICIITFRVINPISSDRLFLFLNIFSFIKLLFSVWKTIIITKVY